MRPRCNGPAKDIRIEGRVTRAGDGSILRCIAMRRRPQSSKGRIMSRFSLFAPSLCIVLFSSLHLMAQYPAQIRVMTYNINYETHKTSGSYDDIAAVIQELNPAIAGLQKLDSCIDETNPLYVLKWLGEEEGMAYTFSTSIENYKGSDGSYGVGFLSDSTPQESRRLWIEKGSSAEDRSALEIAITMGGERVRVIVTHLAYESSAIRTTQIEKILPWIDEGGAETDPVIIMADFNAKPTESSMQLFEAAGFVYVKGGNGEILDTSANQGINHILYRPEARWEVMDAGNPAYSASNRNPVWADMRLRDPIVAAKAKRSVEPKTSAIFSANGAIRFDVASRSTVSLRLYDAAGRVAATLVDNRTMIAGTQTAKIAAGTLAPGIYHCILTINGTAQASCAVTMK